MESLFTCTCINDCIRAGTMWSAADTICIRYGPCRYHWVQSKRHMLWFSTKACSCYSTKTYVDSLILSSHWIWLRWETNTSKCVWCSTKTTFNVHVFVSQQSQIQFEDAVYMSFCWVTTTLSSLRTTACDALIVPSGYDTNLIRYTCTWHKVSKLILLDFNNKMNVLGWSTVNQTNTCANAKWSPV